MTTNLPLIFSLNIDRKVVKFISLGASFTISFNTESDGTNPVRMTNMGGLIHYHSKGMQSPLKWQAAEVTQVTYIEHPKASSTDRIAVIALRTSEVDLRLSDT